MNDHEHDSDFTGARPSGPTQTVPPEPGGAMLRALLAAGDTVYTRVSEALGQVGLSYAKYQVLRYLGELRGPLSLGTLAQCQNCARSNMTQLIDRLEAERLVRRVDDPTDRRSVLAEITPEGARLVAEGTTQLDAVRQQFYAAFTADERAQLARLLSRIQ